MDDADTRRVLRKLRSSVVPFALLLFFFVFLAGVVAKPLAPGLAWAAVLSFFTYPVYRFIYTRVFRGRYSYAASAINTLLILFLLVLPLFAIGVAVTHEATKLYWFLLDRIPAAKGTPMESLLSLPPFAWFLSMFPELKDLPVWNDLFYNSARTLASVMTNISKELLGNALKMAFNLLVITVASFFITHDGHRLVGFVKDVLPLSSSSKDALVLRGKRMLYAIFYGVMLTAGVQGALGALGWWFVGLDNPVFFGALMFFFAMVPFVGTPIVWGPGVAYLLVQGHVKEGLMLLAWGLMVVSSIDNVLRPFFISEGSKAHILLVFVGILGGIATWGILGLFLGPLVLSLAVFFLHMYRLIVSTPADEVIVDETGGENR